MVIILPKEFDVKGITYTIRTANQGDAKSLSELRVQIDGETEHMDREKGEAFIDEAGFEAIIEEDQNHPRRLCLVVEVNGKLVGYSRCVGYDLKRFLHKVEFGLGVIKDFWGYGIGKNLMKETISWADEVGIRKIVLTGVLETNVRGVELYKSLGFEIEGKLINDRILSDGNFHHTYIMARYN